jgi:hypothetical protein
MSAVLSGLAGAGNTLWDRAPASRRHAEDDLQRQIIQYLTIALPPNAVVFHIPNGGLRSKTSAARLKGLGVTAGVPDLLVVWHGRALFIELKASRGVVSAAQKAMARRLIYCGAEVMCCRSLAEVEAALREATVPLKASVAA